MTPTPLTELHHPLFEEKNIQVWMKRSDLNDPDISGNKLYKLKPNIAAAEKAGKNLIISFGGAYSNHIAALAAAGNAYQFKTIGYIRGDELKDKPEKWSHTLVNAEKNGMTFVFLDRRSYRQRHHKIFLGHIRKQFPDAYLLPEGATNELAVQGMKELTDELATQLDWDWLYCGVGTGGTIAGLIRNSEVRPNRKLIGVSTLMNATFLNLEIKKWLAEDQTYNEWQFLDNETGAGYGKTNREIKEAWHWFEDNFNIPLDPVYNCKMVYAFLEQVKNDEIPPNTKVVLLHTGGLQGLT